MQRRSVYRINREKETVGMPQVAILQIKTASWKSRCPRLNGRRTVVGSRFRVGLPVPAVLPMAQGSKGRATPIKSPHGPLRGGPNLAWDYTQTDAGITRKSA
jgi:hypothetical protein